jgi:hypothetical protein
MFTPHVPLQCPTDIDLCKEEVRSQAYLNSCRGESPASYPTAQQSGYYHRAAETLRILTQKQDEALLRRQLQLLVASINSVAIDKASQALHSERELLQLQITEVRGSTC